MSPPFELGSRSAPRARAGRAAAGQDLFWIALAGSVAGFVLLVLKPNRERLREAGAEGRLISAEIASLESRVARLRRWERALASGDREAWAAVARGRLGWLGPGESMIAPGASSEPNVSSAASIRSGPAPRGGTMVRRAPGREGAAPRRPGRRRVSASATGRARDERP